MNYVTVCIINLHEKTEYLDFYVIIFSENSNLEIWEYFKGS